MWRLSWILSVSSNKLSEHFVIVLVLYIMHIQALCALRLSKPKVLYHFWYSIHIVPDPVVDIIISFEQDVYTYTNGGTAGI